MRRYQPAPPTKSLTDQQKYLLQRLPSAYELKRPEAPTPPNVRKAMCLVEAYQNAQRKISCRWECKATKMLTAAREAIYFQSPQKALEIVHSLEALKKCCAEDN